MALAAYRNILRATRIAFQGDERVLSAARLQARTMFREKASLQPADPAVAPAIQHAEAVAEALRANVVQGSQQGDGSTYKLRIHEYTERGDNDTITLAGMKKAASGDGCCSS
ncbi:hypothetical protein M406DRAFT_251321 [Cryphonectria parasitica EP155]|uniref:Mitochondrial zinc maintenance protein 1, mitochondrial n=1 Tax=Cryphonectria parasitica (strain ATCC 38755 / EP155) TaxID=660469 RepID=A0A9P5CSQ5_CRYP1|nr:uncharacterized protein M406DRAFT_251321 [Cryphonectria parasitica EP155]KAF3768606.1 hypothetical protein M406DRAFT_251321 [Cryphonectria parasitica EP155]